MTTDAAELETKTAQPFTGGKDTDFAETRTAELMAGDQQFIDTFPSESVADAKRQPGLRLSQIVQIVMEGYAERPALGQRARELVTDPSSGRSALRLLAHFDTMTFGKLWERAQAVAAAWHDDGQRSVKAGDFAAILGFASPDYATLVLANIYLGTVIVPLQTTAPASQHADIMGETEPRILATAIENLETAVEGVLLRAAPGRLVVFDYDARDDEQREMFEAGRKRLADAGCDTAVETIDETIARGKPLAQAPMNVPTGDEDPLAWLFYTSGTTGTPKGAMMPESVIKGTWLYESAKPSITLSFMPMSHLVGYGYMFLPLANGGLSYCAPKSDLSTLFEDLSLARPTMTSLVPRVCEMLYQHYLGEVDRRVAAGEDEAAAQSEVKIHIRDNLLGGRMLSAGAGSAVMSPEVHAFMLDMLCVHMAIGYSSTELATATVTVDGKVQRPPVIDYRLADVPELGYFTTDKPHPRGELLVKAAKFMDGYYKRPDLTAEKFTEDGFYKTGDVMAEIEPDHLVYVDRCNNVLKLSQGEFVAVARLEALYTQSPVIKQVYIYGSSDRAYLLAVIVPSDKLVQVLEKGGEAADQVKAKLRRALQTVAEEHGLNGFEIPREFLIETEPFSQENGLLTGVGKFSRPNFKGRFGERLEATYARLAEDQVAELRALRAGGADRPVIETVTRAVQATLGVSAADILNDSKFEELGGD
ncbi:MAG: AMP-binding protein, partial [Novosphingobium sp.]|nr:AMP-binding protein [Novosphingobium sp.]